MIELNKKHILPVSDAVAMTVVCLLHVSLGVSVSTAGLTGRLDLNLSKIYMATTSDQAVIYLFKANNVCMFVVNIQGTRTASTTPEYI